MRGPASTEIQLYWNGWVGENDLLLAHSCVEVLGLAPLTQLQKDVQDLQVKLARLEERIEPKKGAHGLRNTIIGTVGTAALVWVGWVSITVAGMNGKLENGGNKALVASLENPKSPALLKANLATVTASIETARAQGTKANPEKTLPLSFAVNKVIQDKNAPSEAWQTASQLINYRSGIENPPVLPSCDPKGHLDETGLKTPKPPQNDGINISVMFRNCILVIDDPALANYYLSATADYRQEYHIPAERIFINYLLQNVHIVYRGGLIEAASIIMNQCSFEFQLNSTPSPRGRIVVERLLQAENIDAVSIPDLKSTSNAA